MGLARELQEWPYGFLSLVRLPIPPLSQHSQLYKVVGVPFEVSGEAELLGGIQTSGLDPREPEDNVQAPQLARDL
jgi:hypothetical protein